MDRVEIPRPHTKVGLRQQNCERLHAGMSPRSPPQVPKRGRHKTPRCPAPVEPVEPAHIWRKDPVC